MKITAANLIILSVFVGFEYEWHKFSAKEQKMILLTPITRKPEQSGQRIVMKLEQITTLLILKSTPYLYHIR